MAALHPAADLDEIAVEKSGQLDFSSRFSYEGDHALRWQYPSGSTLTWNCNCDKLGKSPTFYFTALEPRIPGKSPSTFRIEFLDAQQKVAGSCEMPLTRPFWNRCIIRLTGLDNPGANNASLQVGIAKLVGIIPSTVSAVRITPLSKEPGEVFLGGWIFCGRRCCKNLAISPSRTVFPNIVPPLPRNSRNRHLRRSPTPPPLRNNSKAVSWTIGSPPLENPTR